MDHSTAISLLNAITNGEAARDAIWARIKTIRELAAVCKQARKQELIDAGVIVPSWKQWIDDPLFDAGGHFDSLELDNRESKQIVTVKLDDSRGGDCDYNYVEVPYRYLWMDETELATVLHGRITALIAAKREATLRALQEQADKDRAEYDRLRARFERGAS